jgi:hypothetical protein
MSVGLLYLHYRHNSLGQVWFWFGSGSMVIVMVCCVNLALTH